MSERSCARSWEAEALADGRLGDDARASFQRHAATCNDCSRQTAALVELSRLGETLPVLEATPLERRRLRQSILRRANETTVRAPSDRGTIAVFAAAAALVLALFALVVRHRSPDGLPARVAVTPQFETEVALGSRYRPEALGARVRVRLDAGRVRVHVAKLGPEQSFVVSLPDGQLEVRGTRFTVAVSDDRTESVVVTEGRVALRLRGEPERLIVVGERWIRSNDAKATVVSRAATEPIHPVAQRAIAAPKTAITASPPSPPTSSEPTPSSSAPSDPASAPREFRAAMQAFSEGDYAHADALFAGFIARYPADARSEDATFLRAVSHAQRGDSAGAARLAGEYLARYPSGFRRKEAERLAR